MSTKWSDGEVKYLIDNYSKMPAADVANHLGRSYQAVVYKAHSLKLQGFIYTKSACSHEGCDALTGARKEFCSKHYQRQYRQAPQVKKRNREHAAKHRSTLKGRFSALRGESRRRGLEFSMTFEQYQALWSEFSGCCYCCLAPIAHDGPCLDRLDNSSGYSVENCVLCCGFCNRLRGELLTPSETKEILSFLASSRGSKDVWAGYEFKTKKRSLRDKENNA